MYFLAMLTTSRRLASINSLLAIFASKLPGPDLVDLLQEFRLRQPRRHLHRGDEIEVAGGVLAEPLDLVGAAVELVADVAEAGGVAQRHELRGGHPHGSFQPLERHLSVPHLLGQLEVTVDDLVDHLLLQAEGPEKSDHLFLERLDFLVGLDRSALGRRPLPMLGALGVALANLTDGGDDAFEMTADLHRFRRLDGLGRPGSFDGGPRLVLIALFRLPLDVALQLELVLFLGLRLLDIENIDDGAQPDFAALELFADLHHFVDGERTAERGVENLVQARPRSAWRSPPPPRG